MTIVLDGASFAGLEEFAADFCERFDCTEAELPTIVGELPVLPGVAGVMEAVLEHKRGLTQQMHELLDGMEQHSRPPLASEERRFDVLDQRTSKVGEFLDQALDAAERHKADLERAAHKRKRFIHIIGGSDMQTETSELAEWVRHGGSPIFDIKLERHDLTTGAASAGDVVPAGFIGAFHQHMIANAAVRQTNVAIYTTAGGEPLKIPKSVADMTAAQIAEGGAITANDPDLASVVLGAYGFKSMTFVSRELLEDSDVDVAALLGRLFGRAIGTATGVQYVGGDGTTEPQGCNLTPVQGVAGTWANLIAGATGPDILTDTFFSVNPPYRSQGYWLMADATLAAIRKLKSTTNEYLVDRNLAMPATGTGETIFGRPVVTDPNMPTGAGVKDSILFGDFSSYFAIRDVGSVRLERSDDYRFANDEVAFRAVLRTDSKQVLNDSANAAVKAFHQTA